MIFQSKKAKRYLIKRFLNVGKKFVICMNLEKRRELEWLFLMVILPLGTLFSGMESHLFMTGNICECNHSFGQSCADL
jgi:hypothetical protein